MSAQQNSTVLIDSCNLIHNTALVDGGVMYAQYDSIVKVNNSTFVNNSATGHGGIAFVRIESVIVVNSSTILNSLATSGGVLYISINTSVNVAMPIAPSSTIKLNTMEESFLHKCGVQLLSVGVALTTMWPIFMEE